MDSDAARLDQLPEYFGNILSATIPLIGMIAFIMILIGGFKILTSGGDPKGLQGGQQTISWAVGGLAFAIISWLILLLIENLTGAPVTQFNFGFRP
ncbi:MAG: hypothetical protein Fur0011_1780 [Candidatus Microgenomates bacterium]